MFIHKANIVCPCVHTCWKHFTWFGVLAIKQWVISVLNVFGVTTTRYRLICTLAVFHSGPIFTIRGQHLFNTIPQSVISDCYQNIPGFILMSVCKKKDKTMLLSFASWFKIWLTPWLLVEILPQPLLTLIETSSSETDMSTFTGTINPRMNSDEQGLRASTLYITGWAVCYNGKYIKGKRYQTFMSRIQQQVEASKVFSWSPRCRLFAWQWTTI